MAEYDLIMITKVVINILCIISYSKYCTNIITSELNFDTHTHTHTRSTTQLIHNSSNRLVDKATKSSQNHHSILISAVMPPT